MKQAIACILLLATAFAEEEVVPILRQDSDVGPDSFQYAYETGNGIAAEARGSLKSGATPEENFLTSQGQYQYTAPGGEVIRIVYNADENGYQPSGDHLPTAPPIPPAIQRALEYLATAPPPKEAENAN